MAARHAIVRAALGRRNARRRDHDLHRQDRHAHPQRDDRARGGDALGGGGAERHRLRTRSATSPTSMGSPLREMPNASDIRRRRCSRRPCASNATIEEHDGTWRRPRRSHRRGAGRRRREGRRDARRGRVAVPSHRRGAVLVGAQADEHRAPTSAVAGSSPCRDEGRARRAADAMHARASRRRGGPLTPRASSSRSLAEVEDLAARAMRTLARRRAPRSTTTTTTARRAPGARPRLPRHARHHRPAARGGRRGGRCRPARRACGSMMITGDHPVDRARDRRARWASRPRGRPVAIGRRARSHGRRGPSTRRSARVYVYARVSPEHKLRIVRLPASAPATSSR